MSTMRKAVTSLTLDLSMPDVQTGFTCTLGDRARRLEILVTDGGRPYDIPPTWSAFLSGVTPDQTELVNGCVVEHGRLIYDFESGEQIATCAGRYAVTVWIMDKEGTPVASPKIWANVIDSGVQTIMNNNLSEDQFGVLQEIVGNINALIDKDQEIDVAINGLKENTRMAFEGVNREITQARQDIENTKSDIEETISISITSIPPARWRDSDPYEATLSMDSISPGEIILLIPADSKTKEAAVKARLTVTPEPGGEDNRYVHVVRSEASKPPTVVLVFIAIRLKDESTTGPRVALIGVDSYSDSITSSIDLSRMDEGEIVETFVGGSTKTTTIVYDEDGNPIKITDGDGNVTVLTW